MVRRTSQIKTKKLTRNCYDKGGKVRPTNLVCSYTLHSRLCQSELVFNHGYPYPYTIRTHEVLVAVDMTQMDGGEAGNILPWVDVDYDLSTANEVAFSYQYNNEDGGLMSMMGPHRPIYPRFRHKNNMIANVLFVDGHVAPQSEIYQRNICLGE